MDIRRNGSNYASYFDANKTLPICTFFITKKNSLISFPEVKNVNVSFVEETPKELLSLPKISENYQKAYEK